MADGFIKAGVLVVAAALVVGCGKDGKDGKDGKKDQPGQVTGGLPGLPPGMAMPPGMDMPQAAAIEEARRNLERLQGDLAGGAAKLGLTQEQLVQMQEGLAKAGSPEVQAKMKEQMEALNSRNAELKKRMEELKAKHEAEKAAAGKAQTP